MMKCTIAAIIFFAGVGAAAAQSLSPGEARAIAREATIYGFPLVDNYRVLHSYVIEGPGVGDRPSWNQIKSSARVFTPDDKTVQTPNSDTPYSQLGADLRSEPLVIHAPKVEPGRYFSLQFVDLYTFNFAYVGSRVTGNEAGDYLLAGPGWNGEKPPVIKAVLRSETDLNLVWYRTQLFNPQDIDNVRTVQAGYKVQPLSRYLGQPAPPAPPVIAFARPLSPEQERQSPEFFGILDFVLQFCPTHPSEAGLRARLAKLGIGSGTKFDFSALSPEIQQALRDGQADAWKDYAVFKTTQIDAGKKPASELFGTRESMKNDYMARMAATILGIYGNSKEEALYPSYFVDDGGMQLNGARNYTLTFGPGQLPPVNSFCSLTVYELPASLLHANVINRYLINSPMVPALKKNPDGGVTIYLQHESPGRDLESNLLPIPSGPFSAAIRLYWPKAEALDGRWRRPPLRPAG